jgi:hypothetical protein
MINYSIIIFFRIFFAFRAPKARSGVKPYPAGTARSTSLDFFGVRQYSYSYCIRQPTNTHAHTC